MQRRHHGYTLIELLVASVIMLVVSVFVLQTFTVNHRAYVVIDQVTESQQNIRVVADLIERDLRHAGMMVPETAAVCGVDNTGAPDLLYVSDASAVDPGNDTNTYDGALVQDLITNVGTGVEELNVDSVVLEPNPPLRAAYDVDGDGTNDSDFQVDGGAILVDLLDSSRGVACGRVTAVDVTNDRITVDFVTDALSAAGGAVDLALIPAHEYVVTGSLELRRSGQLLAQGVEDLQLAYFFDADDDNQIDAGEYRGDGTGADYDASGLDHATLREVRLNLVARTRLPEEDFSGQFQSTENRAGSAADGFRRRVHRSRITLRNVGARLATI